MRRKKKLLGFIVLEIVKINCYNHRENLLSIPIILFKLHN